MNCLVLGGGGFIGLNLCEALVANGHRVRVFERPRLKVEGNEGEVGSDKILSELEWMEGDFANPADIQCAVVGCDVIFHLVCTTLPKSSNDNPVYDVESNVVSTVRLLDVAKANKVKKIVFISSGGTVYGIPQNIPIPETHPVDPVCSYGITKLVIEKYLGLYHYLYGMDYCILRVANPYGERQRIASSQGAVAVFLHRALKNQAIEIWGDGSVVRDYVYIGDVVRAFLKAMDYTGSPRTFNIGSGCGHSLNELLEIIESLIGHPVHRIYIEGRPFDVPVNVLDISRTRDCMGWQPLTSFKEGLMRTLEWMRRQPAGSRDIP
jgi:UDP-glucose 4-epimerase